MNKSLYVFAFHIQVSGPYKDLQIRSTSPMIDTSYILKEISSYIQWVYSRISFDYRMCIYHEVGTNLYILEENGKDSYIDLLDISNRYIIDKIKQTQKEKYNYGQTNIGMHPNREG